MYCFHFWSAKCSSKQISFYTMCTTCLEIAPKFLRLMRVTLHVPYSTDVTVTSPATKIWSSAKLWGSSLNLQRLGYSKKLTQFQDCEPKEADHFRVGRANTTLNFATDHYFVWQTLDAGKQQNLINLLYRNNIVGGPLWAKPWKDVPQKLDLLGNVSWIAKILK